MNDDNKKADELTQQADRIDPPVTPPTAQQPSRPAQDATSEAAQDEEQARLTSFQTRRLGEMNVSLNSHPDAKPDEE